ncbi:MAG TPA: hypothetical protein DCS12_10855 [Clostridiales bacterium]|nr:hypothetical protein [Clostridiales bacterium]
MKSKNNYFKYLNFINASIVSFIFLSLAGILMRRFVSPAEYGQYMSIKLILTYGTYMQLGVLNALNLEIPLNRGVGDFDYIKTIKGSALAYVTIISVIGMVVSLTFAVITVSQGNLLDLGYIIIGITLILTFFMTAFDNMLRGEEKFAILSNRLYMRTAIQAGVAILCTYFWGYYGLYIGTPVALFITILYTRKIVSAVKLIYNWGEIKKRIIEGFPIFLNSTLANFSETVPQLIAVVFMTPQMVGYFSIALLVYTTINTVPNVIGQIIYPKMAKIFGKTNDASALADFITDIERLFYWGMAVFSAVCLVVLKYFVAWALPEYSTGISAANIAILTGCIASSRIINGNAMVIIKQKGNLIKITLTSIVINLSLSVALVGSYSINGLAVALLVANIFIAIATNINISNQTGMLLLKRLIIQIIPFSILPLPVYFLITTYDSSEAYGLALLYTIFIGTGIILWILNRRKISKMVMK